MKLLVSLSAGSSLLLSLLEKVHSNVQRNRSSKALQSGLNSRYLFKEKYKGKIPSSNSLVIARRLQALTSSKPKVNEGTRTGHTSNFYR